MNISEANPPFRCFDPLDARRNMDTYRSQQPRTRDELFSYSHLILGHFTSSTFLPSILTNGLQPDHDKQREIDDRVPSDAESVYLCARYDRLYIPRVINHRGGSGIAVVVTVPVASLAPDESVLNPVQCGQHPPDIQLFLSLCFGACKHPGVIPTTSFVGIFDTDGNQIH